MMRFVVVALAGIAFVHAAASSCPAVKSEGEPVGVFRDIDGINTYFSYPPSNTSRSGYANSNSKTAILFVSDIYGVPLLQNKLLADSLALCTNTPVILPDLFGGDAIPVITPERGLNLTEWRTRHGTAEIDAILSKTIGYIRGELEMQSIGAVGYCFGGKYVPRFLAIGKGVDVGFIAHPSGLETAEIGAIEGPISIAAGELDTAFNATNRRTAEDILATNGNIFQTTLYSGAPHGFGVRVNASVPEQAFAKEAAFRQAVEWFDAWL